MNRCRWTFCIHKIERGERYCEQHKKSAEQKYKQYTALYEQKRNVEDKQYRQFYWSTDWLRTRAEVMTANPICQQCGRAFSYAVHHVIALKDNWDKRLDKTNLLAYCQACHSKYELSQRNKK